MKKYNGKSLLVITVIFLICFFCACTTRLAEVRHVEIGDTIDSKGVFYSLPMTMIRVEIPVQQITESPGLLYLRKKEFENFNKRIKDIGITITDKSPFKTKKVKYQIGEPEIKTSALPDPSATFFVKMDPKATKEFFIELELSEDGLLETIKTESTNRSLEILTKTLEVGASIAGKVIKYGGRTPKKEGASYEDLLDEQIQAIKDIRKRRIDLLSGQVQGLAGGTSETLKLLLSELNNEEQKLLNAIKGTTTTKEWIAVFEFIPRTICEIVNLLSISNNGDIYLGECCVNGTSYPFSKNTFFVNEDQLNIQLHMNSLSQPADLLHTLHVKEENTGSFFYRVPMAASINIFEEGKLIASQTKHIAHLGPKFQLANKIYSKNGRIELFVHTNTGSIKKLSNTVKPFDYEKAIGTLGASATSLTETILLRDDELTKLKREKDILELKKAIRDLEEELSQ